MTATLTTLISFTGANGANPEGSLIVDANGDLFGTTSHGGTSNKGTVFELIPLGFNPITLVNDYALKNLVNFNGANGAAPQGSLIADANGDLFGTTPEGGHHHEGTVFELVKSDSGYTLKTLVSFGGNLKIPSGSLTADSNGDLFGATLFHSTVFELVKSGSAYTLETLVNFNGYNGAHPRGSLIADANGHRAV